ncbi:phage tail tip fiber protein [Pseudomonas putida]|uniref:phage tail tip fiber protein n=1 Tax=Pseudomonas putida TaxID=303 RepID=UPI00235BD4F9|nr:DUF1983 domain-containing protein [Pseudomonas putida]GLO27899.1 hypothetical protein PPUJ21368_57300 [Pseudomonas putida]HDS0973204.1 DUF1983 domain-containing protein [Pseudomonas putida]
MSGGVKKIAQVAVGAVIGFIQGGPVGAAIGAGMAFYMAEQQEKLNTKSPLRDNEPSAQTVRSSKAPARFILGRVSTGGVLVWAQEQAGDQTDGEWLHLVYVLCEGPVDALENIYLGEEEIATYGEHASYELVVNPSQVNAFLKANCPDWKDEQIGRGLSFVRLSLKYSAEKFPSGIPDARFIVRGRNDIYDPRTGMAVYTENTALHILWFLRNRCGVPDDEIVFETFASGANVCDESVGNPDDTSSPRYRSSCVIGADEQRTSVLQKLEAACGGRTIRVGGRWMFQAGAYYGPFDFEVTEDMVVGTITGSTEPTNDAAINTVRGTFIDTAQSWTETDYPEVSIAQWVVEDGGEAAETLSFSYVTDAYQAQRLANIELRRRRAGGTISVPMNFLGYNCRPGRAVRVNLPSLNILGEFIVTNWSMGANEGCTAQLQQYEAAQFDDAVGQPYNPIGFISMPAGGLGNPTNVVWTPAETAEVSQGVLSWGQPTGIVTGYAVTVRQGGTSVQAQQVPETTLQLPIAGLPSGNYTMSVAALGPLTRSGEASITVSIDGPPIPESCVVQATIDTITLYPSNTLHGLNGGTYEYFYSTDPQATQGEYLGQGLTLSHTGLAFATNYAYFIRSKNAYGVSAFLKVVASTSTDVKTMLDALKDKIEGGQLAPTLRQEISLISGPPTQSGSVAQRIAAEATARGQAIAAEATARGQAIAAETSARNQAIATEVIDRNKAIAVETQARTKAISDEAAARAQGLLSEAQARGAAVTSEAQARQSADSALGQRIDTVTASTGNNASAIQTEITARTNADNALGQRIDTVAASTASNSAAIGNEVTARTTADTALASQIATLRAESGGFDSTLNYGFASTVEGWSGTRCTLTVENGRLIVTNDSAGAYLNSPLVAIKGRDHDRIRCRITRRAGTGWTGQVSYTTAAHGSSTAYNKVLPNPGLAVGQSTVLEWDMSQLTNGGSDWSDSTITRFYLWISGTAGDVFEIDWIAVGQIAPSASVASVVDERSARISGDEANASAVTALGSSLTTTNQNVTAAQQAAQDAATLAGGKGKVLVQATAPAAADRLPQNLWIDTTGNANTPKRWSGTAWLAVTDKVATDAAAAAQSALSQLAGKADASALQALSTTVTNQGNTLSSQGSSITELNNSLQTTNGNVATAQQAAQAAASLAGSKGKVLYQSAAPAVADRQAENLWIDTTGAANTPKRWNGSAWVAVTDKVATDAAAAAASALAQVANKADASALQALNSEVISQGTTLTSQGAALTQLKASIGQQPDNLILRGSFEDGLVEPWTNNPGITNISAHPSAGKGISFYDNSFCGVGFNVLTKGGEQFDLAADVWPNYMTAGQTTRLQMQFQDKAGASLGYFTAFTVSAASTGFKAQAGRITAPEGAVSARFVTRTEPADGTGRSLWCNILARRVTAADAANAEAVSNLTSTVTQQGTTLTSHGQALTQLNNDLQTVAQGKADASALQTLSNTVTSQGNTLSSQGASITQLNSGLQTTNGNVTAAQQAAQAAADKAGAKGEVIYGTAAPAADKRQAQNLWIDTTGGANTPKRWAGSAWVAVTDKAATDAAAAAASALAQVATKADASALQTLSNAVTSQGNTLTSQGNALTGLQASIGSLAGTGANLLDSAYSWLASTTLPALSGQLLARTGVAVAEADSGFGLRLVTTEANNIFAYVTLAPSNNAAGFNMRVEAGTYLVSMYVKGDTAGQVMANLYDGVTSRSATLNYTTDRQRLTFVITITGSSKVGLLIYPNRHNAASAAIVVDSIMVEKRVGESNAPSPFVAGPSARATGVLAAANQALDVRVTQAENGLSSTSAAVTTLGNSLQTTNGNVTTAQQAAQAAADLAGSKGKVLYQTATPGVADRQAENLWIDTTATANTPKRWNGSAWVAVTDKVATDAAAAAQSALTQLASKADASALQTLQSTVTSQGGTINSQGTALTQLKASLSQQPDNLVLRGTFEDGLVDPWTGNPGIAGLTAHPSAGKAIAFYANSFCGTGRFIVSGGEQLDLSADVYRAYMTAGQTGNFQVQFFDKTDTNLGYFNAFTFSAGGGFQTFSGRLTAPAAAVSARFVTRIQPADGTGRALWCNIVARRVTAADAANGEAISTLGATVTQQGTTLTSQGQSLLSLTNRMTDAEGVNSAQATAISQMDTTVKQHGTAITAAATRLDGLYVQVNPEMEGDSTGLAGATGGLVGVWTEQSARIEDGIAIGREVETVQALMGQTNASVQQVSEVVAGVDGRVSAMSSWKTETNANGKKVATGIIQGSDGSVGEILLSADRVAIINGLNGPESSLFVFQDGQLFLNSALINQAFIQSLVVGMTLRSQAVNSQGLPLIEINLASGSFTVRGQDANGSTLLNNGGLYVYDANGIERTAVGRLT